MSEHDEMSLDQTEVPDTAANRAATRAERDRAAGILNVAARTGLGGDFAQDAIADGTSLANFRVRALDEVAARQERTAPGHFAPNAYASDPTWRRDDGHRVYAQPRDAEAPGLAAARCLVALAAANGDTRRAAQFVQANYGRRGDPVARALSTSIGSAGGFLVPAEMSDEIIELLRPASAVMSLRPVIVPMPAGNLVIPRITVGSNTQYQGENQPVLASQPTFGAIQLQARKLISLVPISNDMIRQPSFAIDGIVRDDMVRSIAVRADLAFIRGSGTQYSPMGLRSWAASPILAGNNFLTASPFVGSTYSAVSVSQALGALVNVTYDLSRMELALANANIPMTRPGWIFSPRTKQYLMTIRDSTGHLAFYQEMSNGTLFGKPYRVTTQIPNNFPGVNSDGTTPNTLGSEIYLADFAEVIIAERQGLELDVFPGGSYLDSNGNMVSAISNDQTIIRAIVQHDMAMRQEAAVVVLTGVCWF